MPNPTHSNLRKTSITIKRDKATFWMDGRGRWHNQHGPFEHKKIIAHFNASIQKDSDGYYVTQEHGGIHEKVYFEYEDTALFIVDITLADPIIMVLNTTARILLQPDALMIHGDHLYVQHGDDRIKFGERALYKISKMMDCRKGTYYICIGDQCCTIKEK
jgi:hypothetical protein